MSENYIALLRQILLEKGISQVELARRLGVTFAALNRWLHGSAKPHPRRIEAIRRLHREWVAYPSVTAEELRHVIRRAESLRRKGYWGQIARRQDLQDDLLLEHTYNSTSIEGTTFSKRETEMILFGKGLVPDRSLVEYLEVTNHAAVLREVLQKKYPALVSEPLICRLHQALLQGIRPDAGEYSRHHRVIRGVQIALTHPKDIPEEMKHLMRSWKGKPKKKTVREIAVFHADFELIHPFRDGNGRVGRLVMVLQCLQEGFPPAVIENARKAEYYEVLEYAQRRSEGPLVAFLADEMGRTAKLLRKYRLRPAFK